MSPDAQKIARYLEDRAKKRGINGGIYYNKLAMDLGFPPVTDAWLSHPFAKLFDELDDEDFAKKQPFRTALVITELTKFPGDGFWGMVLRLRYRGKKRKFTDAEKFKFYTDEVGELERNYH
jgi:hypothetical protein